MLTSVNQHCVFSFIESVSPSFRAHFEPFQPSSLTLTLALVLVLALTMTLDEGTTTPQSNSRSLRGNTSSPQSHSHSLSRLLSGTYSCLFYFLRLSFCCYFMHYKRSFSVFFSLWLWLCWLLNPISSRWWWLNSIVTMVIKLWS